MFMFNIVRESANPGENGEDCEVWLGSPGTWK